MDKKKLCFSTGMHGHFVEHLMYCYIEGKVLPLDFNQNGNAHNSRHGDDPLLGNRKEVVSWDLTKHEHYHKFEDNDKIFGLVFEDRQEFYYCYRRSLDAAGDIKGSGIKLMCDNVHEWVRQRLVETNLLKDATTMYNYHETSGKIPRWILRNYIIFNLISYQEHAIWKSNKQIMNLAKYVMNLDDIFDYNRLKSKLDNCFGGNLDFKELHNNFLDANLNRSIMEKENQILKAIKRGASMSLKGLDVVSEARILYEVERRHFNLPFLIHDKFYEDTREIHEYIKHFPNYLKQPNKLFGEYGYAPPKEKSK
jgi:hypothetical protein